MRLIADDLKAVSTLQTVYRVLIISPGKPSYDRFVNLMNALATQVPNTTMTFEGVSEAAAIARLAAGTADMVVPYPTQTGDDAQDYRLSVAPVTKAYYILYTNTAHPLDVANLSRYTIEGDPRNSAVLGLALKPSRDPAASLQRVHDWVADGYINAEGATDPTLRELGFKNIRRWLYKETHNYVLLPKNDAGRRADEFLSAAVSRAKGTAGYDKMQERPYGDWQP
jgi:hypothetical protein